METEKRVELIEEAIVVMKNLLVNHDERLESHHKNLENFHAAIETERRERKESREDFEFKLNALIDSQIRNEIEFKEIKESIIELRKTAESTLKRVEKLENKN